MLMDKQMSSTLPLKNSLAIGWIERGTAMPSAFTRLLESDGHALLIFKSCEESISQKVALTLFDCRGLDANSIQNELASLHAKHSQMRIALWSIESGVAQEGLIRWPGVKGIFCADCDEGQLRKGVQSMLEGQNWLPRKLIDKWLDQQRSRSRPEVTALAESLTERERQILDRIGDACTNAQIAFDLCISEHTVKTHLYNIYRKIKVRNRTEACNWVKTNYQVTMS
jgi:LuxR family transcriptional regulator, csgAB operon transcriptional regulatory protein